MSDESVGILIFIGILLLFYFIPTIIAFSKQKYQKVAILVTNLFFGWTILGWIMCLIWSVTNDAKVIISDDRN